MTAIPKVSKRVETSLASALSAAGSSFTLESATDEDGNALSGLYGMTIDVGNSNVEDFVVTVSGSTATVVYRGLDADDPVTEVAGNKKAHRRGAPVVITDYPILAYLRNILAGESGYTLPALLKQASTVGNPVDDDDLARKAYVDGVVAGSFPANRIVVAGTAGATIADGNLIYFDDTDNEWKLCDADTASTVENVILGIAQGAGTDGNAITNGVLLLGLDDAQSGLTAGAPYYASNTGGGISASPGTTEVSVGFAKSTTELYFVPRYSQQITEDQQDALAGTSGTPSSSNKFVTANDESRNYGTVAYAASSGGSDTYAITLSPVPTAYATGMMIRFKADVANTGAATLNVNSLGAKTLKKVVNGSKADLSTSDIPADGIMGCVYDGTDFIVLSGLDESRTLRHTVNASEGEGSWFTYEMPFIRNTESGPSYQMTGWTRGGNEAGVSNYMGAAVGYMESSSGGFSLSHLLPGTGSDNNFKFSATKKWKLKFRAKITNSTNINALGILNGTITTIYAAETDTSLSQMRIVWNSSNIYLVTSNGTNYNAETISGITRTDWNLYEMYFDGTSLYCYVNGTLKATNSTYVPTVSTADCYIALGGNASNTAFRILPLVFSLEM